MDLTVFKSLPHDTIARAAAAVVGLFFVRDGIYALQGKPMRILWRRSQYHTPPSPPVQPISGSVATRLFGLVFILMAAFMFLLSWYGFD
jgi:hypothetical protein